MPAIPRPTKASITVFVALCLLCSLSWPLLARDDATDLYERGREQMAARDYAAARRTLETLAAEHPNAKELAAATILLGKAHLYAKNFDAALKTFERLLDKRTDAAWAEKARLLMADAYTAQKRHRLAADILKRRLEIVEGRDYKLMLARHYLAIAETAEKGTPGTGPLGEGTVAKDLATAATYFEKARELLAGEREEAELTLRIAQARFDLGKPAAALQTLETFFKRFPDFADAPAVHILRARAQLATKRPRLARENLVEFERDGGRFVNHARRQEALHFYAESYFAERGERSVAKGVKLARRAIEQEPNSKRARTIRYRMAQALYSVGSIDAAIDAFRTFRAAHADDPRAADALLEIADAWIQVGRFDDARQAWKSFVSAYPQHKGWATAQRKIVDSLFDKAVSLGRGEDTAAGIAAYRAFLQEYPADSKSASAQFAIAALHERAKQTDAAIAAYTITSKRYARANREIAARAILRKAELLRRKKEDYPATIKALREIVRDFANTGAGRQARTLITKLSARELQVKTERIFALDENPELSVRLRNIEKVRVRAYPIDLATYFAKKKRIDRIENIEVRIIRPAVDWVEPFEGYAKYKDLTRRLPLARLREKAPNGGAFIVSLRGDDLECRTLVVLSDLTLVVKSARKEALAFVMNGATDRPAAGVKVTFTDGKRTLGHATTDENGIAKKRFKNAGRVHAMATDGTHVAFAGGANPSSYTFGYRPKAYLYTDRPQYRPGHTVQYKGILRRVSGGAYRTPNKVPVLVSIVDSRGAIIKQEKTPTTEAGTISGSLTLGSAAPLGTYRLVVKLDRKSFESSFEVQEYKKPEMFVDVRAKRSDYLNGERVRAVINGGYYFGGPVKNGKVTWQVFRTPFTFDTTGYREYAWFFEDKTKTEDDAPGSGTQVASGSGTTDENGSLEISFETGEKPGDWRYTVVAWLQGRGRATAVTSAPLFVTERAFYAVVKCDKKAYQPKEAIRVNVTAIDARHTPVARPGRVELIRVVNKPTGAALKTVVASAPVTTDATGRGEVTVRAPKGGRYIARFVGEDRRTSTVTGEATLDVAGEAEDLAKQARIVAEREIYYTGDVARVLLNTPKAPAWALVTFEGERVLEHRVVRLERRSTILELPMKGEFSPNVFLRVAIPADHRLYEDEDEVMVFKFLEMRVTTDTQTFRPGDKVTYQITATDPKGKPVQTELSLAVVDESLLAIASDPNKAIKPFFYDQKRTRGVRTSSSSAFEYAAKTGKIDPDLLGMEARRALALAHKEMSKLAAGEKFATRFRASGPAAPPVPKASAANRFKAPTGAAGGIPFSDRRGRKASKRGVFAADSPRKNLDAKGAQSESGSFFLGRSVDGDYRARAENVFAMDPVDLALDAIATRTRFVDTAAWRPHVVTDENGRATIEITLPDNLTTWRAKAVGVGGDALVGSAESLIRVSKPLTAKLDLPRFLTQGDRARVSAVLHNNTDRDGRHAAKLTIDGAVGVTEATRTVTIDAAESARLDWDLDASEARAVTFTLQASGPDTEDGMVRALRSHAFGIRGRAARSGTTTESATLTFDLPDGVIVGSERFELLLSPGYDTVILDALDYVRTFPHGCLEQTVSRFLPAVACADALRALGLDDPARRKALAQRVRAGLARLYHLERPNGGWGWWNHPMRGRSPAGATDPRMTAYALFGLEVAKRAGFVVDQRVLGRARTLARKLATTTNAGYGVRAMLLHALSVNGTIDANDLNRVYRYRDLLRPAGLARLALAYHNLGLSGETQTLAAMLAERATTKDGVAYWAFHGTRCGGWDRSTIEATGYAVHALLAANPDHPLVEAGIAYLMQHRRGGAFGSTKDTSAALMAFARYAAARGAERADYTLDVVVNDRVAKTIQVRGGTVADANRKLSLDPKAFRAGTNVIRLVKRGPGRLHYAFLAEHYTPADRVEPAGNTLKLNRRYRMHRRAAEPDASGGVRPGWSVVMREFRPKRKAATRLKEVGAGDVITVSVTLNPREALRFVMLEDPLPAGFEVVRDSASGPFDRFERRDDRAVFYFSTLAKSTSVSYRLRAVHPGAYRARPSFAAPMYEPEVWGRSASHAIKVLESAPARMAVAKRQPTPDELYYGGLADYAAGRKDAARTKLRAVIAHRLQDKFRDEALVHLVRLDLEHDPRAALTAFEELNLRNARKAQFDRPTRVRLANAYHRVKEYEGAAAGYRDLLAESFKRETKIAKTYTDRNDAARAQAVLEDILRRYPDHNAVITASYRRSLAFASIPDRRRASADRALLANVAVPTMKIEAIRELKAFTGFYPESPLADDAHHEVIRLFDSLDAHERVTAEASRFGARYPKSRWLDDVLHYAMNSLYKSGNYDAALTVANRLINETFVRDRGRGKAPSPWRPNATYLFGKIHHIRGDLGEAVRHYKKVTGRFNDARDAVAFLTKRSLAAPNTVAVAAGTKPAVELTLKNLKTVSARIYPVDLEILFALRKNLRNVNAIDLTGIPAVAEIDRPLADPPSYSPFRRKLSLPITETGVYLVVVKSGDLEATTIVVLSELDLTVQRAGRTVRVYVTKRADGTPVAGATVRIADGRRIVAEGKTDPRGIYEGPAIRGPVSIVVREKRDGDEPARSFAFHQEAR